MKVTLLRCTDAPTQLVSQAGRVCTSNQSIEGFYSEKLVETVLDRGHLSVLEHVGLSFLVEGISRACSHQLVRHRVASYSQRSQRYTGTLRAFTVPPEIAGNRAALVLFNNTMNRLWEVYALLQDLDITDEDARYVLPNAAHTTLVLTMNARELRHFFNLRCCTHAQWEIRAMANEMLRLAKGAAPLLFAGAGPSCASGPCPEGKGSCIENGEDGV